MEIWTHVAGDGPERADNVLDRIDRRLQMLATYPLIGRLRTDIAPDMRVLAVERWLILYWVKQDVVVVSRVVDGARDLSGVAKPHR
jgi:toxin ParE1/3/4